MKRRHIAGGLAAAVLLALCGGVPSAVRGQKPLVKEVHVLNWEDYFGETTLGDFEKKFGVKVKLTTYDDEDEMMSMVQSNPALYDVVVGSGDQVREMIVSRLLAKINLDNIPNFRNIDSSYRNPHYDPGDRYSVPYLWGTTGFVVNTKFVKDEADSWALLWNPKYRGKIAMLDNYDEVIGAALKYLGHSINSNDSEELEEARQALQEQKPLLAGYLSSIDIRRKLISNELWAAQNYSGEGVFSTDKNSALRYVIPREGAAIWVDTLTIPRDSRNKETAELFINYLLDAKVSAKLANYLWYANCNVAARPYTLKEVLKHPGLYPGKQVMENLEFFLTTSDEDLERQGEQIRNRIWSELRR